MFLALFEKVHEAGWEYEQVDDTVYVIHNATLKPEFRIGPFTERYTGDWNVNLEDLSIELIDPDPDGEDPIAGTMQFTLTPITK